MESVSARRSEGVESEMKSFSSSVGSGGFVGGFSSVSEGECGLALSSLDCGLTLSSLDCGLALSSLGCGLTLSSLGCG